MLQIRETFIIFSADFRWYFSLQSLAIFSYLREEASPLPDNCTVQEKHEACFLRIKKLFCLVHLAQNS